MLIGKEPEGLNIEASCFLKKKAFPSSLTLISNYVVLLGR